LNKISPYRFEADSSVERLPKRKDYDKMSALTKSCSWIEDLI
jgi:hypothetical protein